MISEDNFVDPQIKGVKEQCRYGLLLKAQVLGIGLGTKKTQGIDTGVPCILI
jgi:hypothetical protein